MRPQARCVLATALSPGRCFYLGAKRARISADPIELRFGHPMRTPNGTPDDHPFADDMTRAADPRPSDSSHAAPHRFAADQLIAGRFRVVRFIAGGGMGEIYEA